MRFLCQTNIDENNKLKRDEVVKQGETYWCNLVQDFFHQQYQSSLESSWSSKSIFLWGACPVTWSIFSMNHPSVNNWWFLGSFCGVECLPRVFKRLHFLHKGTENTVFFPNHHLSRCKNYWMNQSFRTNPNLEDILSKSCLTWNCHTRLSSRGFWRKILLTSSFFNCERVMTLDSGEPLIAAAMLK